MVADRHGLAGAGMAAARRRRCCCPRRFCMTMTRWRACSACQPALNRSLTISKFHLGRRERERPTNRRFVGCLAVGWARFFLPFWGRVHPLAVAVVNRYPTRA